MKRIAAFSSLVIVILALLACGGDGLSFFSRSEVTDLTIEGPEDGSVLSSTQPLALQIGTADPAGHPDLEVKVTLLSADGDSVWEQRVANPAPNEDLGLQLPELSPGRYQLEITVYENGAQAERRTTTIFSVRERPRIAGIASFPPLIIASSPVLLSADIAADLGSDPWLRWTWRGKTIAQGSASAGTTAVLWRAPADEGVYTVSLELFPVAPPGEAGFPFRSVIAMSTDIYVSAAGAALRDELGPASSYLSLFHLQADLVDAAAAARDLERSAVPVGSPRIVPVGDGFGYRLERGAGFRVPWPVLPIEDGDLAPFTLSVGIRAEQLTGTDRIVAATAGTIVFTLGLGTDASPDLTITVPDAPQVTIPSGAPSLEPGRRYLVSTSVEPRPEGLSVRWFLDGAQVSETAATLVLPRPGTEGSAVVGGASGLAAVIDELGVYCRDEAGRPATDPTLFRAAMKKQYGERLLLADGFDGLYLPAGFTASGKTMLGAGRFELQPDASLELPPVQSPAEVFSIKLDLGRGSEQSAIVRLSWAGAEKPFAEARLAADSGTLSLLFTGETVTYGTRNSWKIPPAPAEKAGIVVQVTCPPEAKSPLVIDQVLAFNEKGE